MSALDGIFEAAFEEAQARMNQEPRSAATPEINAMFDRWSAKIAHWMQVHDYTIPPPQMDDELWKALEHDARYDPDVNQWFHTAKRLQLMHEQAKDTAELTQFAQAMQSAEGSGSQGSGSFLDGSISKKVPDPLQPKSKSPGWPAVSPSTGPAVSQSNGKAGGRGEVAATTPMPTNQHAKACRG
jgi:hypothetical protein